MNYNIEFIAKTDDEFSTHFSLRGADFLSWEIEDKLFSDFRLAIFAALQEYYDSKKTNFLLEKDSKEILAFY